MLHCKKHIVLILTTCKVIILGGCVTFAPPSPLYTYGGPQTTPEGTSEAVVAVGSGVTLFEEGHAGGTGWLGRYKYGVSDQLDLGFDFSGVQRNDGGYFGAKLASRYQLTENTRLELALGVADDSDGKSLNGDLAYTIGTIKDRNWNYYSSLRLAYAHGYPGNALVLPGQRNDESDSIAPPNTFFTLINIGAQGEVNENQKVIFEGGYGYVFPNGEDVGPALYVSVGVLLQIGEENSRNKK